MAALRGERIGIVGAGAVGSALALALAAAGYSVTALMSRTPTRAQAIASRTPGAVVASDAEELAALADFVFLTVPDDTIGSVAESIPWRAGMAAAHCSGGVSLGALKPAETQGAIIGGFHPLQTFASDGESHPSLAGVTFAIESSEPNLRALLYRMAESLGGAGIDINDDSRALYHISGVIASNYLVALIAEAANLWSQFGYNHSQALRALLPLVNGTVRNLEREGAPHALTGPIVRGDVGTVATHVAELQVRMPDVLALYGELARSAVRLAMETQRLDQTKGAEILALVENPPQAGKLNE